MAQASVDFDRLLKLRLVVARFGEMDLAKWWNTRDSSVDLAPRHSDEDFRERTILRRLAPYSLSPPTVAKKYSIHPIA